MRIKIFEPVKKVFVVALNGSSGFSKPFDVPVDGLVNLGHYADGSTKIEVHAPRIEHPEYAGRKVQWCSVAP